MYNLSVNAIQRIDGATILVSLSETDDVGRTHHVAEFRRDENAEFPSLERYSLEEFLEHVLVALVNSLSTGEGRVFTT